MNNELQHHTTSSNREQQTTGKSEPSNTPLRAAGARWRISDVCNQQGPPTSITHNFLHESLAPNNEGGTESSLYQIADNENDNLTI